MIDASECARIAGELDRLNRERQAIELATVAQAEAEAIGRPRRGGRRARSWSPPPTAGIRAWLGSSPRGCGERFGRPAFAIALEPGGTGTGSGRSIAGGRSWPALCAKPSAWVCS